MCWRPVSTDKGNSLFLIYKFFPLFFPFIFHAIGSGTYFAHFFAPFRPFLAFLVGNFSLTPTRNNFILFVRYFSTFPPYPPSPLVFGVFDRSWHLTDAGNNFVHLSKIDFPTHTDFTIASLDTWQIRQMLPIVPTLFLIIILMSICHICLVSIFIA